MRSGHHVKHDGGIRDRPGECPGLEKRWGDEHIRPMGVGNPCKGRTVPEHSTRAGRDTTRSTSIGPRRKRYHSVRNCRSTPTRRATGRSLEVKRCGRFAHEQIIGLALVPKFWCICFSDNNCSSVLQTLNRYRSVIGNDVLERFCTFRVPDSLDSTEEVFDRDGDAVKRAQFCSSLNGSFRFFRFLTCFVFQQRYERVQLFFP